MYYLTAKHDEKEIVVAMEEQKAKRLARFMWYLDYMYEEENLSILLADQREMKSFK